MIVNCNRCGVPNQVLREKWKCKKCSTKRTTLLSFPEPIVHDEGMIVTEPISEEDDKETFEDTSEDFLDDDKREDPEEE